MLWRSLAPVGGLVLGFFAMCTADARAQKKRVFVDSDTVLALAFAPAGDAVAGAGIGGDIQIWDIPSGKLQQRLSGPNLSIRRSIAFTPDGTTLAVGGDDRAVHLWNSKTGQLTKTLGGNKPDELGDVTCLAISPDGRLLASASYRPNVRVEGNTKYVSGVAEADVTLWRLPGGALQTKWDLGKDYASSVAFSPDGNVLACAEGGVIRLRDVKTGAVQRSFKPDRGAVRSVAFSPDGKELTGGGAYAVPVGSGTEARGEFHVWRVGTGALRFSRTDFGAASVSVALSSDGRTLATATGRSKRNGGSQWYAPELWLWDLRTEQLLRTVEGARGLHVPVAFSPNAQLLVYADDKEVVLIETATGQRRATLMTVTERLRRE